MLLILTYLLYYFFTQREKMHNGMIAFLIFISLFYYGSYMNNID
jgi:hypothetical protein